MDFGLVLFSQASVYCIVNNSVGSLSGAPSWELLVSREFSVLVLWPKSFGFVTCFSAHFMTVPASGAKWQEGREKKVGFGPTLCGLQLHCPEKENASSSEFWLLQAHIVGGPFGITWGLGRDRIEERGEGGVCALWALGIPSSVPWASIRGFLLEHCVFVPGGHFSGAPEDMRGRVGWRTHHQLSGTSDFGLP